MNYSSGFWLFARLTGLVYFLAFFSLFQQIPGLIGTEGILPAQNLLNRVTEVVGPNSAFLALPSLAWPFGAPDTSLRLIALIGLLSSLSLTFGLLRPFSAALS